jgi:hypothetical protein
VDREDVRERSAANTDEPPPPPPPAQMLIYAAALVKQYTAASNNRPPLCITCISVGRMASFMSTVSAPPAPRSSAVTGRPALSLATTIRPRRSLRSPRLSARASTAMISLLTVMSKPVERSWPRSSLPWPTVMPRRNLCVWRVWMFWGWGRRNAISKTAHTNQQGRAYVRVRASYTWQPGNPCLCAVCRPPPLALLPPTCH